MDDFVIYCFHLSRSQGVLYLGASIDNYEIVSILRRVATSIWTSVATIIILISPDGFLSF